MTAAAASSRLHDRPIDKLLDRLDKVKETGPGRWVACCPAHQDKHPSLSVRETSDGTLLVKCWSGCGAADVVAAVGLTLADLFPDRPDNRLPLRPRERWVPGDVWRCVAHEAGIVAVAAADVAAGRPVSQDDADRAGLAADRLADAAQSLGVAP